MRQIPHLPVCIGLAMRFTNRRQLINRKGKIIGKQAFQGFLASITQVFSIQRQQSYHVDCTVIAWRSRQDLAIRGIEETLLAAGVGWRDVQRLIEFSAFRLSAMQRKTRLDKRITRAKQVGVFQVLCRIAFCGR